MANEVNCRIRLISKDKVTEMMDLIEEKLDSYTESEKVTNLCKSFYEDVKLSESGNVLYEWTYDNLGSKWVYFNDFNSDDTFSVISANYLPEQFIFRIYEILKNYDDDLTIEVEFEDEGYQPVGVMVIKKDNEGNVSYSVEEDYDYEIPDLSFDDENYQTKMEEFYESVYDGITDLITSCHYNIDNGYGKLIQ
jgi:hypothetical protein